MQHQSSPAQEPGKPRLAIIGGGIAGLSAAYYLSKSGRFDLSLFEKQPRLGGHAHTSDFAGHSFDTTVVAYHTTAYPRFAALIRELGLEGETEVFRQDLCFHDGARVDYLVSSQPLLMLRHPRLAFKTLRALQRFSRAIVSARRRPLAGELTMLGYLQRLELSESEIYRLVLPMLHMFVGMDFEAIAAMPASFLVEHLYEHKVLHSSSLTSWRSWKRGTRTYVEALRKRIAGRIICDAAIAGVERQADGRPLLRFADGAPELFDMVLFATPPAATRRLLLTPTRLESELLDPWREGHLDRVIHQDPSLLPPQKHLWGFWNPYIDPQSRACGATYVLQKLRASLPPDLFVSWDPVQPIAAHLTQAKEKVAISLYDAKALARRGELHLLNEQSPRSFFCGAHFRYGWHESAVASAFEVTERMLEALPQQRRLVPALEIC